MKTQHIRKDKTCLNCGHEVPDRFCGHCGQENVETKESFGHLVSHFFQDITHYDSKLLLTLKYLFFYPGLLTKKYIQGHRMDYVNPIRLYVFTSFIFFLMLGFTQEHHSPYERAQSRQEVHRIFEMKGDSLQAKLDSGKVEAAEIKNVKTAADVMRIMKMASEDTTGHAAAIYDSLQLVAPEGEKHGFFLRNVVRRYFEMQDKYGDNVEAVLEEKVTHNYPKLMFLLLPFFALLLKWFFFRKEHYYADHAIFAIHFHTFVFMVGLIAILLELLFHLDAWLWFAIPVFLYFIMALRNNYRISTGRAIFDGVLISLCYALGTLIVAILFLLLIFAIA
ncbi:DUF3667 domain-containing protein [Chitinophaga sp. YIM B06452]|uniref:DUF3667 domain-containing protein n=1 Tax=Chitinophaga sp. YIM B06452 TaxID=3082158 RepID=UPI0031FED97B